MVAIATTVVTTNVMFAIQFIVWTGSPKSSKETLIARSTAALRTARAGRIASIMKLVSFGMRSVT